MTRVTTREADAMIAEKVMGWVPNWSGAYWVKPETPTDFEATRTSHPANPNPWSPTTDASASKQLRLWFSQRNIDWVLELSEHGYSFELFIFDEAENIDRKICGGDCHQTEELAVATTSLLYVGCDVEIESEAK